MSRVSDYLGLIDDPARPSLTPGHSADPVLHHLLVDLAYSDGVVQGDEFALLQRVRPDLDPADLMAWAMEQSETPFPLTTLARLVSQGEDALDLVRFAARMVCLDGEVAGEERERLGEIARAVGLDAGTPDRVIAEIVARGGAVDSKRVLGALRNMLWRVLAPRRGGPDDPGLAAASGGREAVCTLECDDVEVAALYEDGILCQFDGGPGFVLFATITAYTRVPVPGAGFHVHTADGRHHACSDARMADLGALLDFLYQR